MKIDGGLISIQLKLVNNVEDKGEFCRMQFYNANQVKKVRRKFNLKIKKIISCLIYNVV